MALGGARHSWRTDACEHRQEAAGGGELPRPVRDGLRPEGSSCRCHIRGPELRAAGLSVFVAQHLGPLLFVPISSSPQSGFLGDAGLREERPAVISAD